MFLKGVCMIQQLFSFFLASLSCAALAISLWCWFRVRKLLHGASARSVATLSMEVNELTSVCESHAQTLKRLSSRQSMRDARERKAEKAEDSTGDDVGEKIVPRHKLREVARARGFKIT